MIKRAAILLTSVSFACPAFAQQSVRTPDIPAYTTFLPNPAEQTVFRVGPISGTVEAGLGYLYTDNASTTNVSTANATAKLGLNEIFENLDLDLTWPLSPLNRIELRLGGQLQQNSYSNGSNAINLAIHPGSTIQLEAALGDFLFTVYERVTILQDPVADPTAAGTTNLNRLDNTLGAALNWLLGRTDLGVGFAYTYSDTLGGTTGTTASSSQGGVLRNSLDLGSKLSFPLYANLNYGIDLNLTDNTGDARFDFYSFSFGPFIQGNLTRLIEIDAGIGPLLTAGPAGRKPEYYAFLGFRYLPNPLVSILGGVDHDIEFSSGLGVTENTKVRLSVQATPTRKLTLTVSPYVNFGSVITGQFPGSYTQVGFEADAEYRLGKRLSVELDYRFTERNGAGSSGGSGTGGSYTQNLISLSLNYRFW